ncbi:hypothetical protein LG634_12930 [Streptomyces bambusae]|uniref:hypothetical protein n=1 Tax=Streptomyces bambusae TaxID=1550616 RepID=UPI001CFED00A|nr:hypothetical protein [Streptomyces bambusae]MCB5165736.1 hypothetical protein [Streptomyces bambusae]
MDDDTENALSQADRTVAAQRMLRDRPHWSDRRIAADAGLSATTVAAIRRRAAGRTEQPAAARVGRDGRVRPLHAAEGRLRASRVIAANPGASLREIAEQAGIATATAKDVRDRIRQGRDPVPPGRQPVGRPAPRPTAAALGRLLPTMGKDPSLRTDAGRTLLHLLSVHALGDETTWRRLARSVPGHRADTLAQAARRCADHWLRFADELETRRTALGPEPEPGRRPVPAAAP